MVSFATISVAMTDALAKFQSKLFTKRGMTNACLPPQYVVIAGILCAVLPFDISQLLFMILGACCYWVVQSSSVPMNKKSKQFDDISDWHAPNGSAKAPPVRPWRRDQTALVRKSYCTRTAAPALHKGLPLKDPRSLTSMPIPAPVFKSTGWEAEVAELVEQIMPSTESDQIVEQLAGKVKESIRRTFPEADVSGFASGDFRRGKAFGVAVPEVDIVISIDRKALGDRLQCRMPGGPALSSPNVDEVKVQKSAIRMITDTLVSKAGFKFRRSAFRGFEPKVTVLAPILPGIVDEAVPLDLSVNAVLPLRNRAVLTESARLEPRAKELILLVRRWAKDRGICHAAKGHLPPYQWSLLAIYFLQVSTKEDGPFLPPLECSMETSADSTEQAKVAVSKTATDWVTRGEDMTTAQLFKDFVRFYNTEFKWSAELVSIRTGKRASLTDSLAFRSTAMRQVGPVIEDPFDVTNNLGVIMNLASVERLHEELARAHALCESGESVVKLLELWTPPTDVPQKQDQGDEF